MANLGVPLRSLAQSSAPVHIGRGEVDVVLQRVPADPPGEGRLPEGRWLLLLEAVRGRHDATVLHLAWRRTSLAGDAAGAPAQTPLALGSAALYGLRRASLEPTEPGLTLCIDVTAHRAPLLGWWAQAGQPLVLKIRAHPGTPETGALSIQALRLAIIA